MSTPTVRSAVRVRVWTPVASSFAIEVARPVLRPVNLTGVGGRGRQCGTPPAPIFQRSNIEVTAAFTVDGTSFRAARVTTVAAVESQDPAVATVVAPGVVAAVGTAGSTGIGSATIVLR